MTKSAQGRQNLDRGEFAIDLGGESFGLRPSYEAINAFEEDTGKGLMVLARLCLGGEVSSRDLALIVTHCIRAWGREVDNTSAKGAGVEKIANLIMEAEGGISSVMITVGSLLSLAVTGGLTATGEVKATTGTSRTTA